MREGYKKTELGEMPVEWEIKSLKDIVSICYGKSQKEVEKEDGKYKILGTGGVIGRTDDYLWNEPSVLIGRKGTIDRPQYIEEPFWTVDTLFYTKLNNGFLAKWLYYYLNKIDLKKYNEATGVPSLSVSILNNIKVITPPQLEQQKIADILSTVDEQIEQTDALIEKTKELKKGLMQRLLTKGIGHTEFKKAEVGVIPFEWLEYKIEDICESVDYRGKTPPKVDEGILLVTAKNIGKGFIDYEVSKEYIREEDYEEVMSRGLPKEGDVLLTTEAPLGNVANVDDENIALAQRVIKFRGKADVIDNYYLKYYMLGSTFQKELISQSTGSTVLGIKGSRLKKINILVPPLGEQKKIAAILTSIDTKIDKLQTKKQKLQALKQGLMQKLLTGKIRVKVS